MKDIGFTRDGDHLVEMNRTEYAALARLSFAVENETLPSYSSTMEFVKRGFEFTKTFEVITAWYHSKFRLNEMQALLDEIKNSLEKVENG
jgi:hypothetical protein